MIGRARTEREEQQMPRKKRANTSSRRPSRPAKPRRRTTRPSSRARSARTPRALLGPLPDAEHHSIGGVEIDVQRAGAARVKRVVYPSGFRWSKHMKPITGTDRCMHAHVGFIAHGRIHMEYPDGSVVEYRAPQIVAIEPGHDGWVVGREPAVLIEFDFERETIDRLALPRAHQVE
jgi:hypothetical protein